MPSTDLQASGSSPADARLVHRLAMLSRLLQSFTNTIDFDEVLRRIVSTTLEEFGADRAWLLSPVEPGEELATVSYEATRPGFEGAFSKGVPVPLEPSRALIAAAIERGHPLAVDAHDPIFDSELAKRFQIRSQLAQILRPAGEHLWAFGLHQCGRPRQWTEEEIDLFEEVGRYATLALSNAIVHKKARDEAARTRTILDQIPEAAAIYRPDGSLDRMNAAAQRELTSLNASTPKERLRLNAYRHLEGRSLGLEELPSVRALGGEQVKGDYLVTDPGSGDERVISVRGAPILDEEGRIIGSVVLSRDVTEERAKLERDTIRRRRADCLASLSIDLVSTQASPFDLSQAARTIGQTLEANVMLYLYSRAGDVLNLVGSHTVTPEAEPFIRYITRHPFRPGEGLPGTVYEIGRPLLFSEIRGSDIVEFGRNDEEKRLKGQIREQSLIACPIESYGERVGVLVMSSIDPKVSYDAEDLAFVQGVAERIAAANHVQRLTRIMQEGQRAAEELARREVEARARFEAVLETAPIGIAVVSADELRFELANPLWVEYASRFGKTSQDTRLIGLRVAEVIPGLESDLRRVAEKKEMRVDEALEVGSGRNRWYMNRIVSPVVGRFSGATQSLTILLQDVSEQVLANNEIEALAKLMEERSARLDSILGSMTDGLWVYDARGQVIDVNPAALAMFGVGSRSEAVARGNLKDFRLRFPDGNPIPDNDMPYARALRGEVVPDYLAVGSPLFSTRDLDLSIAAAPIESGGVVGAVLVIRDISALQELDRKKDEFLSVASHELRTPLTTIKGYTQLLSQNISTIEREDREVYFSSVLGEIDRMMGLISELLDVSRIETKRLQIHQSRIEWVEFLAHQAASFRIQNPGRSIEFEAGASSVLVEVDVDRMRQVVDNLLSNALKYSPDNSPVSLRVVVRGGSVETSVIDRGIGIPRDELPQLFERFHRARNVSSRYYGGLGLGLYIARAIVEAHHGAISVESREGDGSVFTITLPGIE